MGLTNCFGIFLRSEPGGGRPFPASARLLFSLMAACNVVFTSLNKRSTSIPLVPRTRIGTPKLLNLQPLKLRCQATAASTTSSVVWDDVLRITATEDHDAALKLDGYFHRIRMINRGRETQSQFVPFMIEGHLVGHIHNRWFMDHLKNFTDVFMFLSNNGHDGSYVTLHPSLKTRDDRTTAVGDVMKRLGGVVPGVRNELYPVHSSSSSLAFFYLERAAAPYFGIKAYEVHMNGYVNRRGQKYLWIAKRSDLKPTFPGLLDHVVAGGLPHGISCKENILKECKEEAGILRSISTAAMPVGAVSYVDINGYRYMNDVIYCYDLELPDGFVPKNEDGEVDSFHLMPVEDVAKIVQKTDFFKPNCCLVIIDFLIRHGYITPEDQGYLQLLQGIRSGDFS